MAVQFTSSSPFLNSHLLVKSRLHKGGEQRQSNVVINRSSTQRQSRFTELDPHGRPQSQHRHNRSDSQVRPTVVADAPRRRDTWGHKNRREPPFGHHDSRCHSPWHGYVNTLNLISSHTFTWREWTHSYRALAELRIYLLLPKD